MNGYLYRSGNQIESTHNLRLSFTIDRAFRPIAAADYQPTFDGKKFNVSIIAFAHGSEFVMIHAEMHTDGSGGLDYSKFVKTELNKVPFTSREQCAEIDAQTINEEHDLKLLSDGGFSSTPAIWLKQYYATSSDGTSEVVVSFGHRLRSCSDKDLTAAAKSSFDRRARMSIIVSKRKIRTKD